MENVYYDSTKGLKTPGAIFVFGSNTAGRHGKGAALTAHKQHGAIYGIGSGLTGMAYAIPTKTELPDKTLVTMSIRDIVPYIQEFVNFTIDNTQHTFYITPIGCGLAGYQPKDIAPHFKGVINSYIPDIFERYIEGEKPLWFSKTREEGGFLSNFYPCEFEFRGKTWKSVEHAYQAMKFSGDNTAMEYIRNQPNAFMAAKEGRSNKFPIRHDWDSVKDAIMFEILKEKFDQNPHLVVFLLATGNRELIELSYKDGYWGRHPMTGVGFNKLGRMCERNRTIHRERNYANKRNQTSRMSNR